MKIFEASVRCEVFARVIVKAENERDARSKILNGGGYWDSVDFEKDTARNVEIESTQEIE